MANVSKALAVTGLLTMGVSLVSGVYLTYIGAVWDWAGAIVVLLVVGLLFYLGGRMFRREL